MLLLPRHAEIFSGCVLVVCPQSADLRILQKNTQGTLITEWKEGAVLCDGILGSEGESEALAQKMVCAYPRLSVSPFYTIDKARDERAGCFTIQSPFSFSRRP